MDFEAARANLIKHLSVEIEDEKVLAAMSHIPRELFIPQDEIHLAYEDRPLPIGFGQTISQPFIIALMTASLELTGEEKVLEVGTGSGYQAAILAELAKVVITVERMSALAVAANEVLSKLGYKNIKIHIAEHMLGWQLEAPYDAIIVTAGAPKIPEILVKQLKTGGRMVIPVGSRYDQDLYKIIKQKKENIVYNLGGCRFVPLIGEDAWMEEE
ncbi:MAG: protein-L-isoaspartate(D-aspartate) O-methyltransferase [Dehalococcoidia bacterium]|nr:MAG: protein-L-isoaspartate(D-aspartate) O-methyltransferase [Dehalococcoidia bacterium]